MGHPTPTLMTRPFWQAYWFLRMLVNSDKFGSPGTVMNDEQLASLCVKADTLLNNPHADEYARAQATLAFLESAFTDRFRNRTTSRKRVKLFMSELRARVKSADDAAVFLFTISRLLRPANQVIRTVPNDDRQYAIQAAESLLKTRGEAGVSDLLVLWDELGVNGCLSVERQELVAEHLRLRTYLDASKQPLEDQALILTAFDQEVERRLAQKRKGRAGRGLEDVASFLFNYFKIHAAHAPVRFQADVEVDKWVKAKDGWLIGISCKRTLRERWKQVSSADSAFLAKHKVKALWHLITFDEDLSDDKISILGAQNHLFFLRDSSRVYAKAKDHQVMSKYVMPLSKFVSVLRSEVK